MYCVRKVTEDLYWVGANDHRLTLFENCFPIPRGVSYNAYCLLDEKTALHSLKTHEWIEKNCSIVHYNGKYKPWKEGYIGTLAYLWHREEKSLLADAQREL